MKRFLLLAGLVVWSILPVRSATGLSSAILTNFNAKGFTVNPASTVPTNVIKGAWEVESSDLHPRLANTQVTVTNATIWGYVDTPYQSTILALGANCVAIETNTYWRIGATTTTASQTTLQLGTGSNGRWLRIQKYGTDGNTFTLTDDAAVCDAGSGHVRLRGNWTPTDLGETIDLISDGNDWFEISRANPTIPGGDNLWQVTAGILRPVTLSYPVEIDSQINFGPGSTNTLKRSTDGFGNTTLDYTVLNGADTAYFRLLTTDGVGGYLSGFRSGANGYAQLVGKTIAQLGEQDGIASSVSIQSGSFQPNTGGTVNLAVLQTPFKNLYLTDKAILVGFNDNTDRSALEISHTGTNGDAIFSSYSSGIAGQPRPFKFNFNNTNLWEMGINGSAVQPLLIAHEPASVATTTFGQVGGIGLVLGTSLNLGAANGDGFIIGGNTIQAYNSNGGLLSHFGYVSGTGSSSISISHGGTNASAIINSTGNGDAGTGRPIDFEIDGVNGLRIAANIGAWPNDATKYFDGSGHWSTPSGAVQLWENNAGTVQLITQNANGTLKLSANDGAGAGAIQLWTAGTKRWTVNNGGTFYPESLYDVGTTANPVNTFYSSTGYYIGDRRVGSGAGSPEGVTLGEVGALFLRTDGTAGTTLYTKTSGSGNTGWTAISAGTITTAANWTASGTTNSTLAGVASVNGLVVTNQILAANGSAASPSIGWSSDTDGTGTGFYRSAANQIAASLNGAETFRLAANSFYYFRDDAVISLGVTSDTLIARDAANTLALRNSTAAQRFNIYNTYTDASNYERGSIYWTGNTFFILNGGAGTGSLNRDLVIGTVGTSKLQLWTGNTERWDISSGGHLLAATDNTYDIGASGATRPRSVYVGTKLVGPDASQMDASGYQVAAASLVYWSARSFIASPSDGVFKFANAANNDFNRLQFGGTTASFPAIKRSSATLQSRLADDSAYAVLTSGGVTDASSAAATTLGEVVSSAIAVGSAVTLTNASAWNVTSISLTAGDWDVRGNVNFAATTATVTGTVGGISTTSATLPTDGTEVYSGVQVTVLSETDSVTLPSKVVNVSSTTTVYLVGKSTFSAGSVAGFGSISARRIR